jgi:hypothetical protein
MYDQMTKDDPPMIFWNSLDDDIDRDYNHFIHSPKHPKHLFRRAKELGIQAKLYTKENIAFGQSHHYTVVNFFFNLLRK